MSDDVLPDLRDRIPSVAYDLFGRLGYHGTTTRMLATELGVSVPALYYYYRNKQELLVGIMTQDLEESIAYAARAAARHASPVDALCAALRHHIRRRVTLADTGHRIHRTEMRFVEPAFREAILSLRDQYERIFRTLVDQCRSDGVISVKEARIATRAMLQMASAITDWYRPDGPISAADIENTYLSLIWSMLGGDPTAEFDRRAMDVSATEDRSRSA